MQSRQDTSFQSKNYYLESRLPLRVFGCLVQARVFCVQLLTKIISVHSNEVFRFVHGDSIDVFLSFNFYNNLE